MFFLAADSRVRCDLKKVQYMNCVGADGQALGEAEALMNLMDGL